MKSHWEVLGVRTWTNIFLGDIIQSIAYDTVDFKKGDYPGGPNIITWTFKDKLLWLVVKEEVRLDVWMGLEVCAVVGLKMERPWAKEYGQPLGDEGGLWLTASKERDLRPTAARKWGLQTTWMILRVNSSSEPSDKSPAQTTMWFLPVQKTQLSPCGLLTLDIINVVLRH